MNALEEKWNKSKSPNISWGFFYIYNMEYEIFYNFVTLMHNPIQNPLKTYLTKTPFWLKALYPFEIWKVKNSPKTVYLTFDDGPIPEVTPQVLEVLKSFDVKATFFCIGDNVKKHPKVFQMIVDDGHQTGNHTFNHLKGWQTETETYMENATLCEAALEEHKPISSWLFRPPYGKIKRAQSKALRSKGYKIVMWDILSADYDCEITPEKCYQNSINKVEDGSIIVFHDSLKASKNMLYALPKTIKTLQEQGFKFDIIR